MSQKSNPPEFIAAIDLGSNSFHMIVARLHNGQLIVIDKLREMVRLAEGISCEGELRADVAQRAIDCLKRFGQRLHDFPSGSVRAVGTNTLRNASQAGDFILRAEEALGHPIDIITGVEEARLIYLGVSHGIAEDSSQRLVMDIGVGSTELIVGKAFA
ncbi:MAG: exopolyphosphatase, partial [Gammaproteobacteria bacterium]|nr:exopolyphosphatase [Gammaproteobacteria bacterium]